jgi:hypothetical protein
MAVQFGLRRKSPEEMFTVSMLSSAVRSLRYKIRRKTCKIWSAKLKIRRVYFDFLCLYKITHSLLKPPFLISQITFNTRFKARRSNETNVFVLQINKNNISFYNPLVRMARRCDELAVNNLDLDIFTAKINKCLYQIGKRNPLYHTGYFIHLVILVLVNRVEFW